MGVVKKVMTHRQRLGVPRLRVRGRRPGVLKVHRRYVPTHRHDRPRRVQRLLVPSTGVRGDAVSASAPSRGGRRSVPQLHGTAATRAATSDPRMCPLRIRSSVHSFRMDRRRSSPRIDVHTVSFVQLPCRLLVAFVVLVPFPRELGPKTRCLGWLELSRDVFTRFPSKVRSSKLRLHNAFFHFPSTVFNSQFSLTPLPNQLRKAISMLLTEASIWVNSGSPNRF